MKNVTKILTAVTLCAALFASQDRINALGKKAALWPGDEANIAAFPAQVNNHSYVQIDGVGMTSTDTYDEGAGVSLLTQVDGTTWGFNYGGDSKDWVNMAWGNGTMGVVVGLESTTCNTTDCAGDESDMSVAYGNVFSWGELGVKYTTMGNGDDDAELAVNYRTDSGFWLFDNTVVSCDNLMGDDLEFDADFFTHMDAGGADVVYGWGFEYDGADDGGITQTATIGVEANMTDWATLRAGYNWSYTLTNGDDDGDTGIISDGLAFGLGFNWGGLSADMGINSGIFQDPIGTITGYGDSVIDGTVTLTYSF